MVVVLALALAVWLGYVVAGSLLLLALGRPRKKVANWAQRQLTLRGSRRPPGLP
jgi:hypothetical protein